ncbi:hypothetical protein BJP34_16050 [Moorena producens PAL-8-15-08-1]|uniref:Class I SAM-dependent methyltransferase n=2 Tax=Moorena TaxID=1155738 RepID=A0A1D8TT75_9CYAN|nr:hypothetical protein BJP34_16050 [Moorena producens PAL-8-15-08-1]
MGPPEKLIQDLAGEFQINNFVETGTYYGATAKWASTIFNHVFTIENSVDIHTKVVNQYSDIKNIDFIFGDSRTQLSKLTLKLKESTLFWLDAHWSGGLTYGQNDQCPLLEEIAIVNSLKTDVYLFIDDARLFLSPPQPPHNFEQWPNITQLVNSIQYTLSNHYTVIIEDCVISVPLHAKSLVVAYCQDVNVKLWEEYGKKHNRPKKSM